MERGDIPDTITQCFGHTANKKEAAWGPRSTAVILSCGTQDDLLVLPESYIKFLNVEVLEMSSYYLRSTENQAPLRKGKLQAL